MTTRFPVLQTVLAGLALGSLAAVSWPLRPARWLAPELVPATMALSVAWLVWRLWCLDRCLAQWHRWRVSPTWTVVPEALALPGLALFGRGFRWDAAQVAVVEQALLRDGRLPEGRGPRGGYPALQAVGYQDEQAIWVPWHTLTTHVGLVGMTGSGKSRQLESLLAQAIGADDVP